MFATLAGGKIFSKIDLSSVYLQLELSEASKNLLTVNTHKGLYQYERLPFGVSVAPSQFQCVMDKVLSGMKGVVCFLDDILISSKDEEEHLKVLDDVLSRLDNHGIKANRSKCYFMVSSVTYLGHRIDAEGVHPTQEKVEAILNANVNGVEQPVAYASRTLTSAEINYSQVEREALAIVFGVTKFNKFLYGRKFTFLTDHEALTVIFGPKRGIPSLAAARLQRWALILMAHQYGIIYRKSADHANADVLSRFPVKDDKNLATELPINYFSYTDDLPVSAQEISAETRKDPVLGKVLT